MNRINLKSAATFMAIMVGSAILVGCGGNRQEVKTEEEKVPNIVRQEVTYMAGSDSLIGYLYYDENITERRPGVIVVHEWWGNNEYPQMRARMLAELGYVAFAADMFGNGKVVDNPQQAQESTAVIYSNPDLLKERMTAAYLTLTGSDRVETERIASIGYCFGGAVSLHAANMGVPLDVIVSFHGGYSGFKANPELSKTQVLICNGGADEFVTDEEIENLKSEMTRVNASYEIKEYEGATHAFTNPAATEAGEKFNIPIAYNQQADEASWQDMKNFFDKHLPLEEK